MANCVFGSPDAWRSLLRAMPNVSFLVLFSCDFDNAKEASLGETLPCSIQKLGLIFNDSAANAVSYLALQHLAELELELRDTTDADLLRTVLEESDRSLTTLCVLGQFLFPQRMADLSECFVATKRAALRAVQVRGLKSASVPSYATLLGALLSSLSSPVIERIGLQWEQHPEADTLQVIDSILSSTTTFPSLKEFALFTNGTNGDAVPFPDTLLCLPQLALRGVLPSASEYHRYDWKALLRQGS
ncbi:hypothetical protein PUNSTDRAFT_138940 [Punctularia strigosozonata HHB-11173 SS5]|uniref:Uncharacterized protein n=1 Tax=Punctularia strigosozonata (strain HHB-11173) TaxID=741275 RepID=R7S4N7_PUNST|nr:uncharacterized protein PUNSTDRAFT_138940 [Punctularia strigosozonata HHB-11173 SS5]EIN04211.1 hypothetical protein PUNSTDRAFT_138940 [Punctularia strigosozonata HHB-11173 SS5]